MTKLSLEQVREFFEDQSWKITDEWDSGSWSITARADGNIRVSVDEPSEYTTLNNIIIKSPINILSSIDEYETAVDITEEYVNIQVKGRSEEGLFTRLSAYNNVDLSNKEIAERLDEKDITFGVKFVITKSSEETSLEEVKDFVESVQSAQNEL